MNALCDRIEAFGRWLLRMPPKPSTAPVLTPFARHARRVRAEALRDERAQRRTNFLESEFRRKRRRHA